MDEPDVNACNHHRCALRFGLIEPARGGAGERWMHGTIPDFEAGCCGWLMQGDLMQALGLSTYLLVHSLGVGKM